MIDQPPLLPPDVDLRGLDYMPLFGNHLFGSEFNASSNDSEWRAAVTLWWAAWNQVPAGSLPNDDIALCRLADLGRDVKSWRKLRAKAMHGFVLCSDGRLYHKFLCQQAAVAWDKRIKERNRKAAWRGQQDAKKTGHNEGHRQSVPSSATGTKPNMSPSQNADVPAEWNGMDGNGREVKYQIHSEADASAAKPPSELTKEELWRAGKSLLASQGLPKDQCGSFVGGLVKRYTEKVVIDAVRAAVVAQPADAREYLQASCMHLVGKRTTANKYTAAAAGIFGPAKPSQEIIDV